MFLPFGTGIFGMSLAVESAFVADTDTFFVEATGVCADAFERAGRFDIPIFADIKMVSRPVESRLRWQISKSYSVNSLSSRVAEQWITINFIGRIRSLSQRPLRTIFIAALQGCRLCKLSPQ